MSQTFVKQFTDLLKDRKSEEILGLFTANDPKVLYNSMSEIVSVATSHLTESNAQYEQEVFKCCKIALNIIAEKYNPMETVLEFLEHIEFSNDDTKIYVMLEPLRTCMMKMKENKSKTIEWCLSTIKSYIEELPIPNSTADEDEVSDRIMNLYKRVIWFLEPMVQEAVKINCTLEEGSLFGDYLLSFLISLHGKPFCYINKSITQKETYKKLLEKMMKLTFCLTEDILHFLDVISKRKNSIRRQVKDFSCTSNCKRSILFQEDNISNLAYANFYFHVITKENLWRNVPQVYSSYYIFETCMYLFKILLCEEEETLISNGLTFMDVVIKRISSRSVGVDVLEVPIYLDQFNSLINIMVYCNNESERKRALHIFQEYIEIFNMRARYSVLSYLYGISEISSGLMSLITNMFKSSIIECLNSTPQNPQFLGKNMELMLKKACNLPHGSSTDLLEISDEVITTLNLLRFLYIRDRHNETGIWCITNALQDNYLKPLREGIDLCKAHWRVKMKDLEQQKKHYTKIHDYDMMKKADTEVTLTIGGQPLPIMPLPEKLSFCYRAINGLDVMESILIRVTECINTGKEYRQEF